MHKNNQKHEYLKFLDASSDTKLLSATKLDHLSASIVGEHELESDYPSSVE